MSGHEIVIDEGVFFVATCVCGWRGQQWESPHGAGLEGDWHVDHPTLSGEHKAIEIEEQQ